MKILLVIDHFGPGGAQRQIVELACGLKRRGHSVEVFAYFPRRGFFRPRLDEQQIVVNEYDKGSGFSLGVVRKLAALITDHNIDVVVSYLSSPNIYAELAKLVAPRAKLIVSERTSHHDDKSVLSAHLRRGMHVLADHVVTNSLAQCAWLTRRWWLRGKVSCIYNGLDPGPFATDRAIPESGERLRLVAIGRIGPEKNALNLIRGLELFHREVGYVPEVSWVGERDGGRAGKRYCQRVDELLESSPEVRKRWRWLGVETDVPRLLREHHALIHPSFYEGLPNVVCEALAAGMPVLVSNVCDHPRLVADGERGFLFDPAQPGSIAAAIKRLVKLSKDDWRKLSRNARRYAEENLNVEKMITAFENLFVRLLAHRTDMNGASREDCP
jgi:glycosyltransferase involved in cell wall biosynthesis